MLAGRISDAVSSIAFMRRKNTVNEKSLYQRLGSYDGITAFVDDLLPRLQGDSQLGRFWQNRGDDGLARERQLLIVSFFAQVPGARCTTLAEI